MEMMLRKRTRSNLKDHQIAQLTTDDSFSESDYDFSGQDFTKNPFFNAPLFVGFNSKSPESDSARSPTSPLDFRMFSNLRNPFRSPRSSQRGNQKFWFSNKVGLSILDSPNFGAEHSSRGVLQASGSRNVIFGIKTLNSQSPIDATKSPSSSIQRDNSEVKFGIGACTLELESPENSIQRDNSEVKFEIGACTVELESTGNLSRLTFDSKRSESSCLGNNLIGNISPSEIELSEDYTCIRRIHGPNPKVTHIFCDCILECHDNDLTSFGKIKEDGNLITPARETSKASSYPASDFLRFCSWCNKNLDGEDIYMYRGEKAFCSCDCRLQEILIDGEMDTIDDDNCEDSAKPSSFKESAESSWFI